MTFIQFGRQAALTHTHRATGGFLTKDTNPQQNILNCAFTRHNLLHATASMPNLIYLYYKVSSKWPTVSAKVYSATFILIIVVLILYSCAKLVGYRASKMMKH